MNTKRFASFFMICLALINFSACTNSMTSGGITPKSNPQPDPDIEVIYLDENDAPTDLKTGKVLLSFKGMEDLALISEKTSTDYKSYIISGETVITMFYKDMAVFPHRITVFTDDGLMIGDTTPHRNTTEDFDIMWFMAEEDPESMTEIPLKNSIYNDTDFIPSDIQLNYQIKIAAISIKIWAALDEYSSSQPNARIFKAIANAFNKAVKAVSNFIRSAVELLKPKSNPIAVAIISLVSVAVAVVTFIIEIIKPVKDSNDSEIQNATSGDIDTSKYIVNIKYYDTGEKIKNGEFITGNKSSRKTLFPTGDDIIVPNELDGVKLVIEIPEREIKSFNMRIESTGTANNYVEGVYATFSFQLITIDKVGRATVHNLPVNNKDNRLSSSIELGNGKHYLIVNRKLNLSPNLEDVYLNIDIFDGEIFYNDEIRKDGNFKIGLDNSLPLVN